MSRLLLIIFLSTSYASLAQEEIRNSSIGISSGISLPAGDFGGNDLNNSNQAFAAKGLNLDVQYAYLIRENMGLTANLRHTEFQNNVKNLATPTDKALVFHSAGSGWQSTSLMLGLLGSFPFNNNKFSLETRALIGPMVATSEGVVNSDSNWVNSEKLTAFCFGYMLGASVSYQIKPRFQISFNADFVSANPTFTPGTAPPSEFDVQATSTPKSFRQKYTTLNAGIGIAYKFSEPMRKKNLLWGNPY